MRRAFNIGFLGMLLFGLMYCEKPNTGLSWRKDIKENPQGTTVHFEDNTTPIKLQISNTKNKRPSRNSLKERLPKGAWKYGSKICIPTGETTYRLKQDITFRTMQCMEEEKFHAAYPFSNQEDRPTPKTSSQLLLWSIAHDLDKPSHWDPTLEDFLGSFEAYPSSRQESHPYQ